MSAPPTFDEAFRRSLRDLFAWRRDVRRFRTDPVPEATLRACLDEAQLSPSVGNSQPWRFVRVADPERRAGVATSFARCNADAALAYAGTRREQYRALKLAGLREAPVHLAVFCDAATQAGQGLGRATMPEMLRYSVVGAVQTFWLAARARGLGVGWPVEEHADPELARHGWQAREPASLTER